MKKIFIKLFLILFLASQLSGLSLLFPKKVDTANLTSASATLSNSRLSFYGAVDTTLAAGATTITLDTAGTWADENTNHLFPNDTIAVGPNGYCGTSGTTECKVGAIIGGTTFALAEGLRVGVSADDPIYATQSGSLTISFKTTNDIPASGDVLVTLPDPPSNGNDGAPDSTNSTSTNGFDLNGIGTADVTCSGGGGTWTTTSVTAGSGSGHTIVCTTSVAATDQTTAITVEIDNDPGLVNPAPVNSGHTQGTADIYTINIKTRDASDNTIDEVDVKVAPVEAVLVSATVEESLSFTIAGLATGTYCGQTTDVATNAYSVPWGTISTPDSFLEAAQQLTISTNADAGYSVKIEQNDQMGKDGVTCTGNPTDPTTTNCIPDNPGDGTLDYNTSDDCDTAATNGMCFTQESVSGSPTLAVEYNVQTNNCDVSPTFCARVPADQEPTPAETKQTIFSNTVPVSGDSVYVCYRISVDGTQPAGYYYNKVKYTATATF